MEASFSQIQSQFLSCQKCVICQTKTAWGYKKGHCQESRINRTSEDHVCLQFSFKYYCSTNHLSKPCYSIQQANIDRMCHLLAAIEREDLLTLLDIHSAWNEFVLRFTNIINECIPFEILGIKRVYLWHE